MIPVSFQTRNMLVENIKYLETQLADREDRLNIITDWINSQCFGYLDIPETVIIAISGSLRFTSVSHVTPITENTILRAKVSTNLETKSKLVNKEQWTCDWHEVTHTDKNEQQNLINNPHVNLDTVRLQDTESFTARQGISCCENSSLLHNYLNFNKGFQLRIPQETHKLGCESKSSIHNESSQSRYWNNNLMVPNEENVYRDVLSFTPTSTGERESGVQFDPLGDTHSTVSFSADVVKTEEDKNIDDLKTEYYVIKEEIDFNERTAEDNVFISQHANMNEPSKETQETTPVHFIPARKDLDDILMLEQRHNIKLNLLEYEKLAASRKPKSLTCVVCSKIFVSVAVAVKHEMSIHLSKENKIEYLNRRNSERIEEMKTFSYICGICERPCKGRNNLWKHRFSHVSSEVVTEMDGNAPPYYRCLNCDSMFSEKRECIAHVVLRCPHEKQYKSNKRKIVERVKYVKPNAMCEICGLILSTNYNLKMHMRIHTGERDFVCAQCGKAFAYKKSLKCHELAIHTNIKEKTHKCRYCEKSFVFKSDMDKHENLQHGVLKVSCHICGFTFSAKHSLKLHIAGVHENRRSYKCSLCDKSFKTASTRNYHLKTHSNPNGRKRGLNQEIDSLKAANVS